MVKTIYKKSRRKDIFSSGWPLVTKTGLMWSVSLTQIGVKWPLSNKCDGCSNLVFALNVGIADGFNIFPILFVIFHTGVVACLPANNMSRRRPLCQTYSNGYAERVWFLQETMEFFLDENHLRGKKVKFFWVNIFHFGCHCRIQYHF